MPDLPDLETLSETVRQQRQDAVETLTGLITTPANDPRYPRRGLRRIVRTLLLFCWTVFLWYVGRAGINLVGLIGQGRFTTHQLITALLLPGPLSDPRTPIWVVWGVGVAAVLLLYWCLWATRDREREQRIVQKREIGEALSRSLPAVMREQLAVALREIGLGRRDAPAEAPLGPPFDLALLPTPPQFVGRADDLRWLLDRLRAGEGADGGAVAALGGMGGIGKTTLVAEALRILLEQGRYPDGLAVVLCQGLSDPVEVLRRVLGRFDPQRRQPASTDLSALGETAQRLLAGKHALVVLDNVEPALPIAEVVAPLRAAGAALVLTARHALPHDVVPVAATRTIEALAPDETLDLFAQSYGRASARDLTADERGAAERIVAVLGRHTLAVKLAGAYAADLHRDLHALAMELADPQRAIALPRGEAPEAVARVFAESTHALPPDARMLFAALSIFAAPQFGRRAVLAVGQALGLADPERTLDLLVLRALLTAYTNESIPPENDAERLRLHPLLRGLAQEEFATWPAGDQERAQHALASYYATYLGGARPVSDRALAVDETNIGGALEWAHSHTHDALVVALCIGMSTFWRERWRTEAALRSLPWGIAAADRLASGTANATNATSGNRTSHADLALLYGQVLRRAGRLDEAEETLRANLDERRAAGDATGEAAVLLQLGNLALRRGRAQEADGYASAALARFHAAGNQLGEADALSDLGQVRQLGGQTADALRSYHDALALYGEVGDRGSEAWVLTVLGQLEGATGRPEQAQRDLQRGLTLAREAQDAQAEGAALVGLAQLAAQAGQADEAEERYRDGLTLLRSVQDAATTASAALEFGTFLAERRGQREEGCALILEAARLYGTMGLSEQEARARARASDLGCE